MGLTVYISNTEIQAVSGSGSAGEVRASSFYKYETPEGSVLNGVITDPQLMTDALKEFWKENNLPKKNVDLVINSPQLVGRVTNCPRLKTPKMLTLLEHEFMESERQEKQVVGFTELGTDKKGWSSRIFAEMSTYDYIMSYDQIFSDAGVTLSGISSGIGKLVNLVEDTDILSDEITIMMMLDNVMLTTIFFLNKKYYYSSATRVFAARGSNEFGVEIARVISRLNQFSRAENITGDIKKIDFSGFTPEEVEISKMSIENLNIGEVAIGELVSPSKVKVNGGDEFFRQMTFPIAGLLRPAVSANVLASARKMSPQAIKDAENKKLALPYVIITGILLIVTLVLTIVFFQKKFYLDSLNAHNNDPVILAKEAEYDEEIEVVAQLERQRNSLELLKEDIETYPSFNASVRKVIEQKATGLAEIDFTAYDAASGIVSIKAIAANVEATNKFIELLKKEDIFEYVHYTGYTYNPDDDNWTINMVCALSENAGK
ncbi:MAG: hypothetical protein K6F99_06120 [Lachnospiraceae bacterium]|nr:hypothetical protein [Lachnospiraceae bacterium]